MSCARAPLAEAGERDRNEFVVTKSKSGILLAVASGVTECSWDRSIELPNVGGSLAVGLWTEAAFT